MYIYLLIQVTNALYELSDYPVALPDSHIILQLSRIEGTLHDGKFKLPAVKQLEPLCH